MTERDCTHWHRSMFARFKLTGKNHITCGRPWAEHGDLGECPIRRSFIVGDEPSPEHLSACVDDEGGGTE